MLGRDETRVVHLPSRDVNAGNRVDVFDAGRSNAKRRIVHGMKDASLVDPVRYVLGAMALRSRVALLLLPRAAAAQQGAPITGVVHDSIAHKPLAGARVQLVTADHQTKFGRSAISDERGRYTLDD